jgi:hypothetical protein
MSLMNAHVKYSQNLAVEFSHLIKDYEEFVEAPEVIELDALFLNSFFIYTFNLFFSTFLRPLNTQLLIFTRGCSATKPGRSTDGFLEINSTDDCA